MHGIPRNSLSFWVGVYENKEKAQEIADFIDLNHYEALKEIVHVAGSDRKEAHRLFGLYVRENIDNNRQKPRNYKTQDAGEYSIIKGINIL